MKQERDIARSSKNGKIVFENLYNAYYTPIYRFIFRLIGNSEDAEDLVQDVFMKLYRNLEKNIMIEYPRAWLFRVAANKTYDVLRKRKKFLQFLKGEESKKLEWDTHDAEKLTMVKERLYFVRQAFNRLTVSERLQMSLYHAGLSYLEIGHALGINRNSIGKKLHRTRSKLVRLVHQLEGKQQ